ncbi:MAG TPA: hypothetical protein PLX06_13575 [Fimbriimonadaceae bacterium]|nr:hypothetical protein [Fimbriimonadaceae bacterium]
MRQIAINLPDRVAAQAQRALEEGWFNNMDDLVRAALVAFFEQNANLAIEQQQLADIEWAKQKRAS